MSKEIKVVQQSSGIGLGGCLFLLFTGLKLTGYIDWSWWWVTSPLWLPLAMLLACGAVVVVIGIVIYAAILLWEHFTKKGEQ